MPTRELFITRSSLKRKKQELISNAPIKKARIQVMKELATKFKESNLNKDKVNNYTKFYKLQKDIYPWLKKESLRWHIRNNFVTPQLSLVPNILTIPLTSLYSLRSNRFAIKFSPAKKLN